MVKYTNQAKMLFRKLNDSSPTIHTLESGPYYFQLVFFRGSALSAKVLFTNVTVLKETSSWFALQCFQVLKTWMLNQVTDVIFLQLCD